MGAEEQVKEKIMPESSILTSVKKLLGLPEENTEFDLDIILTINGTITILTQIGVGPSSGFIVMSKEDTYEDWLGDVSLLQSVPMYLYYKTRLSFDPPTSASVIECLKEMIKETEIRLSYQVDPDCTFKESEENKKDEEPDNSDNKEPKESEVNSK